VKSYAWQGLDAPRFELVFVEVHDERLSAQGTQIGTDYRLTYALETAKAFVSERLAAECQTAGGTKTIELRRGRSPLTADVLDIDLGFSPLFNTLPVLRDRLHRGGPAHDYQMAWIDVPTLDAAYSDQRYIPLDDRVVRYRSGAFAADIRFDDEGFVLEYPGLARRVG
jgi:uncharacterized protein